VSINNKEKENSIILDDGTFYVQLNETHEHRSAPGFLLKRCNHSITSPGGFECIGSFDLVNGRWMACLNGVFDIDGEKEGRHLGSFKGRLDAIHALWMARIS
jgi:hypothetical protein